LLARQYLRHGIDAIDLCADDAHALRVQGKGDAGGEPATTNRHDHHIRRQRAQFEADRALSGNDIRIIEGREQAVIVLLGKITGQGACFVEGFTVQAHRRTPMGDAGNLGLRRVARHHRDHRHAQPITGPGQALRMVAGRGGNHRAGVTAFARGQQGIQRAAHLVGAGALQVFQFQPATETFRVMHGCGGKVRAQACLRGQHIACGNGYIRIRHG
jgi:hypothetical protein